MFDLKIGWLVPVALTIVSLGLNVQSVKAQGAYNSYTFSADYTTSVTIDQNFRPDLGIVRATITGESVEPVPYGLNFFTSNTYGKLEPIENPAINRYTFNSDPGVFGLNEEPILSDRYYGGSNELFGTANDSAEINFDEGTIRGGGTITVSGGTGLFRDATGTITFTQEDILGAPGTPSQGLAKLNFNLQTSQPVPEPKASITFIGMAVIGIGLRIKGNIRRKGKGSLFSVAESEDEFTVG
ncbi:hypothetical protein IQ259_17100 [Fortiea sp. LEGE XX443]|uniref:hypothetical protein n=1 Tax=Fortiea sp. LEGE XX443 TaxID=1828611 RepID=UPI00187F43AA|nr:hypothetical protein [Fortiea sp. LEGE XX443]MBE9006734.1 hypothetical protein [Fortiea sp. LEGE XX443]